MNSVTAGVDYTAIDFVSRFPRLLWCDIWFFNCSFHPHNNFSHFNSSAYRLKICKRVGEPITLYFWEDHCLFDMSAALHSAFRNKSDFNWSTTTLYLLTTHSKSNYHSSGYNAGCFIYQPHFYLLHWDLISD